MSPNLQIAYIPILVVSQCGRKGNVVIGAILAPKLSKFQLKVVASGAG